MKSTLFISLVGAAFVSGAPHVRQLADDIDALAPPAVIAPAPVVVVVAPAPAPGSTFSGVEETVDLTTGEVKIEREKAPLRGTSRVGQALLDRQQGRPITGGFIPNSNLPQQAQDRLPTQAVDARANIQPRPLPVRPQTKPLALPDAFAAPPVTAPVAEAAQAPIRGRAGAKAVPQRPIGRVVAPKPAVIADDNLD